MKFLAILSAALLAASSVAAQPDSLAAAKAAVARSLKDPGSARFDEVKERKNAVCGWVNAKNSMGGYTGRMLFVYVIATREAFVLDQNIIASAGTVWAAKAASTYEKHCS